MVKIRYTGGRSHYAVSLNRKSYYFTKENGRVLDINDQAAINYIFSLGNRAEFQVIMEELKQTEDESKIGDESKKTVEVKSILKKRGRPKKGAKYG